MEVDYYYLLGVPEDASPREIKAAYRKMAEVYHPDKLRELGLEDVIAQIYEDTE